MTSSSAALNARSNPSRLLAFAARIPVSIFDHIGAIGEESGAFGASQITRAPHSSAPPMRLAWRAPRWSSTSTSPRLMAGRKTCPT